MEVMFTNLAIPNWGTTLYNQYVTTTILNTIRIDQLHPETPKQAWA